MAAVGIIFSNIHDDKFIELTNHRTTASIPFGGRYRLVDFALSNMIHADITTVGIIAKRNYESLVDHVGSGKDWDLSRKNGGLFIFPPFGNYHSEFLYKSRLDALKGVMSFITKCNEEQVLLLDCDSVHNVDFAEALKFHNDHDADITIICKNMVVTKDLINNMSVTADNTMRITKASLTGCAGESCLTGINMWIINRRLLLSLVSEAIARGYESFEKDIVLANIDHLKMYAYDHKGIFMHISSLENYFRHNMALLDPIIRRELFEKQDVYTKVLDSAPSKYGMNAVVKNSFIADGCIIEGTVVNSIIFRDVRIGKNTVVENSILMQGTTTGENDHLNFVVTDKDVVIKDRHNLSGCAQLPYYLPKNTLV
jgi:glucose-1-phosphate adenylyltransferase